MFKAAFDVYYQESHAKAVCILFQTWQDFQPTHTIIKEIRGIAEYQPGAFYKRELPCILKLAEDMDLKQVEVLIIDGFVYLDDKGTYGLGGHLYHALQQAIPVIGVAKTRFH